MAKQNNDLPKATRVIYVFEAIQKIKEASPEQILNAVANRMAVKPDTKLKRLIYRDLKDLRYRNQIGFDSYHADGVKVDIDDTRKYKNIRHIYYITSGVENVKVAGIGNLDSVGCAFYPSKNGLIDWKITPSASFNATKKIILIITHRSGHSVSISVSLEELPVKILIGRTIKNIDKTQQRLIKSFGNRTAILVIKEKSISSENDNRLGHAIIEISSVQNIKIHDFNSTNGTYAATCGQLSNVGIRKTDKTIRTDRMLDHSDSNIRQIYEVEKLSDFTQVKDEKKVQAPFILKTGYNYIYVGYV